MADAEALKRLGGGRWKTADDRFSVEPQSGSWVVIDVQQTDDLGLPLVRGPFASLTAARTAIEAARTGDPPVSPLAARVEEERLNPRPTKPVTARTERAKVTAKAAPKPPEPPPPPEPAWIAGLPASRRTVARQLIERLTAAAVPRAEAVARSEVADGEPSVARVALERQLRRAIDRHPRDQAVLIAEVVELLASGEDGELMVRWRLVDGDDRPMAPLSDL